MTSTIAGVIALLDTAATAAAPGLAIGEPVTTAPFGADVELPGAVMVPFTGSATGVLVVFVDDQIVNVLTQGGAGDLAAGLVPAVDAMIAAFGTITPGIAQVMDPRMARNRIAGFADNGEIALQGASGVRAAVAIGLEGETDSVTLPDVSRSFERLDLLRGVEMQASAELGRARMTVNELLNLRAGAVVELDRAAGDPADLYVNGRLMARGEVVVVDENYALRITQIVVDEGPR